MKSIEADLKPCKHCGGAPVLIEKERKDKTIYVIRCVNCGHRVTQRFWTKDKTMYVWNNWRWT